jgi:hypothetical protein
MSRAMLRWVAMPSSRGRNDLVTRVKHLEFPVQTPGAENLARARGGRSVRGKTNALRITTPSELYGTAPKKHGVPGTRECCVDMSTNASSLLRDETPCLHERSIL